MDQHKQEARAIIATINKTESYWTCSQNEGDQLNIDLAWIPIADALCKRDAEIEQLRIENAALSSPQPGREQNELFRLQAENQKLDDTQAEIRTLREFIYHHSFNDSYLSPEQGWVCFHCGVRFLSQGAARSHFGDTPNDVRELRKQLIKRDTEIAALKHDIGRHLDITSEQATEIDGLQAELGKQSDEFADYKHYCQAQQASLLAENAKLRKENEQLRGIIEHELCGVDDALSRVCEFGTKNCGFKHGKGR